MGLASDAVKPKGAARRGRSTRYAWSLALRSALALAALQMPLSTSAVAAQDVPQSGAEATPASPPPLAVSDAASRVVEWILATGDNRSLPFVIIDKTGALLLLFDAKRRLVGQAPVLIGVAPGDEASPGIGRKRLAEIGPAERTTPAGRFLARFARGPGRQKILWVDYADSVALHPIPRDASRSERREARMRSPTPADNRITFGCINVPTAFYNRYVRTAFRRTGGYVYVLPDTKPIETVFPALAARPVGNAYSWRVPSMGDRPTPVMVSAKTTERALAHPQ